MNQTEVTPNETHQLAPGKQYKIGDAVTELGNLEEPADVIYLDDAWSRPYRGGQFGVDYPTHPFNKNESDNSLSTQKVIDACFAALNDGGWLIADADDWLLPRMTEYIREEYGDVTKSYKGGGYRKVGSVTYLSSDGTPDRSTPGMYLSNGGYSVLFAHKGSTDRRTSASARQVVPRQREKYGWGSVKPVKPYQAWLSGLLSEEEHLVVPCAGTAPAAIAVELEFGSSVDYTCIDIEEGAYDGFRNRAKQQLPADRLSDLSL